MMDEYSVEFTGSVGVEADSPEEAKQKAMESVDVPFNGDIHSFEPENLSDSEPFFMLKLTRCGHTFSNGSYGLWKDKSAMLLAYRAVNAIVDNMPRKDDGPGFKYDLACLLLSSLEGDGLKGENLEETVMEMKDGYREHGKEFIRDLYQFAEEDDDDAA